MSASDLGARIHEVCGQPVDQQKQTGGELFRELLRALEDGSVRAAEPDDHGGWKVNTWVKEGILLGFRIGKIIDYGNAGPLAFSDKETYPAQRIDGPGRSIRVVPGGSSVRAGSYVSDRVTIMPPAYINVGAWVGEGTLVDSHALVGSCAQVGARVHLSAAAQIGGVLEPIGALPVIIEDDVFVGGNTGVYEGTVIKKNAVIGAGVILTASTPVYDLARNEIYRRSETTPLVIPEGAVVIPGSRPARGDFAGEHGLHLAVPIIVKYRDAKSDAATSLEEALR